MNLRRLGTVSLLLSISAGCHSRPARIAPPKIDAQRASAQAMEMFDGDGDGKLAGAELDQAPGIKAVLAVIDKDGDGQVSGEELAQRLEELTASRAGALPATCRVTMGGRPLADATVTFEPEPFLQERVSAAVGTTDYAGIANLQSEAVSGGAQVGFYRVRISKLAGDRETIPAKYNQATTLGAEISRESPAVATTMGLHFSLTP